MKLHMQNTHRKKLICIESKTINFQTIQVIRRSRLPIFSSVWGKIKIAEKNSCSLCHHWLNIYSRIVQDGFWLQFFYVYGNMNFSMLSCMHLVSRNPTSHVSLIPFAASLHLFIASVYGCFNSSGRRTLNCFSAASKLILVRLICKLFDNLLLFLSSMRVLNGCWTFHSPLPSSPWRSECSTAKKRKWTKCYWKKPLKSWKQQTNALCTIKMFVQRSPVQSEVIAAMLHGNRCHVCSIESIVEERNFSLVKSLTFCSWPFQFPVRMPATCSNRQAWGKQWHVSVGNNFTRCERFHLPSEALVFGWHTFRTTEKDFSICSSVMPFDETKFKSIDCSR